jgi:hypothetical protein
LRQAERFELTLSGCGAFLWGESLKKFLFTPTAINGAAAVCTEVEAYSTDLLYQFVRVLMCIEKDSCCPLTAFFGHFVQN